MQDEYAGIADRYDLFWEDPAAPRPAEEEFYVALFREHSVRRVLDCACGTGRDLLFLRRLGCEVVGADISPAMLGQAQRNVAEAREPIPLVRADYRALPFSAGAFDAVVCLASSFLHVSREEEAVRALASMRRTLRPGGILVLTQGTTERQTRERPRFILARDDATVTRLFVLDYDEAGGTTYHLLDVIHGGPHAGLHAWSTRYARIWTCADYLRLLSSAGFTRASAYGDYDRQPYDVAASRRLIVVAVA